MPTKIRYFSTSNNKKLRTKLHFRYVEATKIKQREDLTDEYFYERKFPDLWYRAVTILATAQFTISASYVPDGIAIHLGLVAHLGKSEAMHVSLWE